MFLLKKTLSPLLYPLPICLQIMLIGLILLWFTPRQRAGKWLVTTGVVLAVVFAEGTLSGGGGK
jgi:hypothetical protein